MKNTILICTLFLFFFSCKNEKAKPIPVDKTPEVIDNIIEPEPEIEDILEVPEDFAVFLETEMPGYNIVSKEKWLDSDYLDVLNENRRDKIYYMNHIFQTGDFNGDGKDDYATFLEDKKGNAYFYIFHKRGNSFKKHRISKEGKNEFLGAGLELVDSGFLVEGNSNKEAGHANNGVSYIIYEKSARTYYLDEGRYKSFMTSD